MVRRMPIFLSMLLDHRARFIDAHLAARQLVYNGIQGYDVSLSAAVTPGHIALRALALTYLGASIRADGRLEAAGKIGRVSAKVVVSGPTFSNCASCWGLHQFPSPASLTHNLFLRRAALLQRGGPRCRCCRRRFDERRRYCPPGDRNGVNRHTLIVPKSPRNDPSFLPLGCVEYQRRRRHHLAAAHRTASGTVVGEAQFDLYRRTLDLMIGSQPASTGIFALDIPIRVYGTFANPTVRPAEWSPASRARFATATVPTRLPPSLQQLVNQNPCLHPRAGPRRWVQTYCRAADCGAIPHSQNHAAGGTLPQEDCSTTVSTASVCLVLGSGSCALPSLTTWSTLPVAAALSCPDRRLNTTLSPSPAIMTTGSVKFLWWPRSPSAPGIIKAPSSMSPLSGKGGSPWRSRTLLRSGMR